MKNKILALALILLIAMSGSGFASNDTPKIKDLSDLKGKVVAMVLPAAATKDMEVIISNIIGAKPGKVQYYDRYSDCVTALATGKVDAVYSCEFIIDYYAKRNQALKMIKGKSRSEIGIIMALRNEDQQIKAGLDKAISTLRGDGTLKRLEDQWVTNLPVDQEPVYKDLPKLKDAKTVYVGVSGNYAPLDYIAADGRPSGYNVALLAEISKLLKINFEIVSIESSARFAALSSKKIDIIFFHLEGNFAALQKLKNRSWIATIPYYISKSDAFLVRK